MKIKSFLIIALAGITLNSCLKSTDKFGWEKDSDAGTVLVGIYDRSSVGEAKPFVMELLPSQETMDFLQLKIHAPRTQPANDIQVTLELDDALITAYNNAHGTSYLPLPANAFTLPSPLTFTIPKTSKEFIIPITINKSNLNLANQYALGVKIVSISEGLINDFEKEIVATFLVKNIYDGKYSYVSGLVTRYTAPGVPANDALSGPLGPSLPDVSMITTGATTVRLAGLQWSGGGGVGGVDPITLSIDPVTNLVTSSSGANASFGNWAGKENKYDPATKTFTLNFRWNPTSTTREYSVVFKYSGSR